MGQRHQAFIIARVIPYQRTKAQYRCVGALHHQWCYGSLPLKAAHRFMTLIRQPDNAEVVREELRAVNGLYGRWRENPVISNVPCPFTQSLFISAWTSDLNGDSMYASDAITLHAGMGAAQGDNNDGITVIDITDPENPSYCFVFDLGRLDPISAETYIRSYYEDGDDDHELRKLVQAAILPFVAVPVIVQDVLAEAWPGHRKDQKIQMEDVAILEPVRSEVPSLVDMTLKPAVEQAVADNNIDALDTLVLDPTKASIIENIVRSKNPVPEAGFRLLLKIFRAHKKPTNGILDLSGFHLSGEHIINFIREYVAAHKLEVDVLNLSNNDHLNIDGLRQILAASPILRRLVLFNTAVIDAEIIALVRDEPGLIRHVEALVHPAFTKAEPDKTQFAPAFTYCYLRSNSYQGAFEVSIPFFTPNSLVQALTDYMHLLNCEDIYYPHDKAQVAMAAFAIESRPPGKAWAERTVPFVPSSSGGGQWTLIMSDQDQAKNDYAFIRFNKERPEEGDPSTVKATDGSHHFDLYDIQAFIKELELEGRPGPDPGDLERLCDIFTKTGRVLPHDTIVELLQTMDKARIIRKMIFKY